MQKYFLNKKLVITLVGLIVSFLLIAFSIMVRNNRNTPTFIQSFGNDAAGLVDRVVGYPVKAVRSAGASTADLLNTYHENQQLKRQVDSVAAEKATNATLRQENADLKKQLKLNKSLTEFSKINAYTISRAPSTWQNQIVISKGSLAGVVKGSAVLSDRGLIGRVTEVNKSNSKVELLSTKNDSSNRFPVQVAAKSGTIINGLITDFDDDTNQLIMGQITSKDKVKKGTKVVTSGLGGTTPKGLLVGTVAKVKNGDAGLPTKIYIDPAADFSDLSMVTVTLRKD
ncbi:rod shape-determining protein MreC [Ligilactobacillus saerimneri]|uniref:rod shape-determining protein MreC n=1 Tax=Ligilactobacillus saerimneri TaxID=228229 RepID=UPI001C11161F|nr:rod shape-determining protein MreC [Ligilactobacillus saerimneri]MBU5309366.1 rod shape-determining protein MreC [Ligilactobacillus saerimneri]